MIVHYTDVFIQKGVIRYPERALRHSKYLTMRSLIPLIQRGADVYDTPYHRALSTWTDTKEQSDSYHVLGRDDYFIPICNVEKLLRKDHHDMVFNTTALYGNTEVKRVYTWREGTIGPLNRLENIAGARLRFLAMTRYPLPRPEVIEEEYTRKDGKKATRRTYVYGKTKGKTTVVITHPFLPELDFVDLLRGHLVELCRQCFIHSVPMGVARQYIDLLILKLRPSLDRLYVSAVRPSSSRLGTHGFLEQADMVLDEIIPQIRGLHGSRSSYPKRVTERIRSGLDQSLPKSFLLEIISDRKSRARLKSHLTDTDASKLCERINNVVGRVGTRIHRRTSWGLSSPSSLRGVIHGGDYIAEDTSGYIHATEVPVFGGRGKVDHNLFVRRQTTPSLTECNMGQGSWFPALSLDLKTKSAFRLGVRGKGDSKKKEPISLDFVLRRKPLTDSEWSEMLRNSPSPRELRQITSYGKGVLEEYHGSAREDLRPPPINIRGVILVDGTDPPSLTREVLTPLMHAVYHKIREDILNLKSQTTDTTVTFPRSLFEPVNEKHRRLAIVTSPFEVTTNTPLDGLFPLPVPLTELFSDNPFKHRNEDSNHFVLYESVATHGSPGDSAALIARNFHGLEYALELAKKLGCRDIAWLDLAGDYSEAAHRPLILRLHHQSEETRLFYEEIEFIDLSSETYATLFDGAPVPSVKQLTERLEHYEMIIVSGIETVRSLEPRSFSGLTDTLVTHIASALTSTTRCTLWFDTPVSLATASEVYKHPKFRPLRHDSPLLPYVDEIVLNLPYPPRPGGSEVPICDYARGIVCVAHRNDEVITVKTMPVIPLIGWSRRFRSIDLTELDKNMMRRLKRHSKTNLWLKRLGIGEFSEQMAMELFPFLGSRLSHDDSDSDDTKRETGEIKITRKELMDKDRNKDYKGILSRVSFDKRLCQEKSIKKINARRKYWTPRLEIRPLDTVPLPPPESDLMFQHYDPVRAESIEVKRLQEARRILLDHIPEYSPFHDFFREFVEILTKATKSKKQQGFTDTIMNFLRTHHFTKDIWHRTAWSRNHLGSWVIPGNMRKSLEDLQTQDADLLLRYGNYVFLLLAYVSQSHSFSQNELNSLWEEVRPWVSLQLGAVRASRSLPDSVFNMDSLYRVLSTRTQSFRSRVRSKTVPLTDVRYGITVEGVSPNPGRYEWFLFESAPYDRGVVAGCIRKDLFRSWRYLSSDTVIPLDELGALAGHALTKGRVSPLMMANYSGMDVLYQSEGATTHSLDIDFNKVHWQMRGASRFGTRYRGAPARLRYLKILNLGMTYPEIPSFQLLPGRDASLAKRLFSHLGVIQSQVTSVSRVNCLVGGDIERGFIELSPLKKEKDSASINIQYHSAQEVVSILQSPYRTGLPFHGMTWDPLEDIRYGLGVKSLKERVTSELLWNRRDA